MKRIDWPEGGVSVTSRDAFDVLTNRYPVNAANGNEAMQLSVDADGFMEVSEAPTGFMAIKRSIIDAMMIHYPDLSFVPDGHPNSVLRGYSWRLFDVMVEPVTNRYLSEDYAFCRRWRDMGGKVHIDTTAKLTHQGTHLFKGDYATSLRTVPSQACGGVE